MAEAATVLGVVLVFDAVVALAWLRSNKRIEHGEEKNFRKAEAHRD
jgi:hypothetical protein